MKSLFAIAALLLASVGAQASEPSVKLKPLIGAGLTFGGDALATVDFSDGSSQKIRSGGLFVLYVGGELQVTEQMAMQATMGYHIDDTSPASNGSVRFSRYPLDVLAMFSVNDRVRLGGGVQTAQSPNLVGSGAVSGLNRKFEASTGAVIEVEYLYTSKLGLKARFVTHKFKEKGSSVAEAHSNHLGLMANWYF